MSSAVIAENYSAAKLKEYICFVEQLGSNIHFHENKWVCSNLRRSPEVVCSHCTLTGFRHYTEKQ